MAAAFFVVRHRTASSDRAAIVVVGPADVLAPQLEDLGPIEIVQP